MDESLKHVRRVGRYGQGEKRCSLWWSGAGILFKTACTFLTADLESNAVEHAPWMGVMADGEPIARFPLLPGRHTYPILAGMDRTAPHEITLLRDSMPTADEQGPVILHGIRTDGSVELPAARERLIEFIGDSLTVGEGCTGAHDTQEWRMAWICHMGAFPTLAAEALHAEKRVIAVSGWGAWKSWDGIAEHRLGLIYENLCGIVPAGNVPYDFSERPADAVVINLGTNDANALNQAEDTKAAGQQLAARCVELMALVRQHQPDAIILWAYGLCGDAAAPYIQQAVHERQQAGDTQVFYLPLSDCHGDVGSRAHPSRAAHRRAPAEIVQSLQQHWQKDF